MRKDRWLNEMHDEENDISPYDAYHRGEIDRIEMLRRIFADASDTEIRLLAGRPLTMGGINDSELAELLASPYRSER